MAATGLVVLTTGFSTHDEVLVDRLFDTAIGIVVGLAVNLVVWPPLRDYAAARAIDAVDDRRGRAAARHGRRAARDDLHQDDVTEWVDRTRDLDEDIDQAWALLRQSKESGRLNPRRAARTVQEDRRVRGDPAPTTSRRSPSSRSMARTLGHSIDARRRVGAGVPGAVAGAAARGGRGDRRPRLGPGDPGARRPERAWPEDLSDEDLSARHWPEYGALIMNLRNVVTSMDRVAQQNPVVLPRYAKRDRLLRRR